MWGSVQNLWWSSSGGWGASDIVASSIYRGLYIEIEMGF